MAGDAPYLCDEFPRKSYIRSLTSNDDDQPNFPHSAEKSEGVFGSLGFCRPTQKKTRLRF